jgi:hypothetical protein
MKHVIVILTLLFCSARPSHATAIFFTYSTVGSGSLGANNFTNALITLTYNGDTANIISNSGFFADPGGTGSVNVSGIGAAAFTDSMEAGSVQGGGGLAFLQDITVNVGVFGTLNTVFSTYTLSTSIGPITGPILLHPGSPSIASYNTSLGSFIITSAGNATYTSVLVTPEPTTFFLFLACIAGMAACKLWPKWRRG